MKIGLIGAGNMASALARGWNEPALVSDVDAERARALAEAIGGSVVGSNAELARQADVVILCHKPAQLADVAGEIAGEARAVASILGGVSVAAVEEAYPDRPVYRFMPNQPAEIGRGITCYVPGARAGDGPEREIVALFERVGAVVPLPEEQMEVAMALMSCSPAWIALVAESLIDAGSSRGMERELAERLVGHAVAGTGEMLTAASLAPEEVRRRVTSPGGLTERGTKVLEEAGLRDAFDSAVKAAAGV